MMVLLSSRNSCLVMPAGEEQHREKEVSGDSIPARRQSHVRIQSVHGLYRGNSLTGS